MVNLNDVFAGKDPDFMNALFPEGGWRGKLNISEHKLDDWSWFWDKFAPNGMLISEDPPRDYLKSRRDISDVIMKSLVFGLIESETPTAKYTRDESTLYYWRFLKKDVPDDIFRYSNRALVGEA